MKSFTFILSLLFASVTAAAAGNNVAEQLISSYQTGSTTAGNAEQGQQLWEQKFSGKAPFTERSCMTCHTSNLKQAGQHVRTKKIIEAMAPSVNSARLSDVKTIEKWLKRNCKWTLGRECSNQEKVNLLTFINQQ